jgi:hypothetical protein
MNLPIVSVRGRYLECACHAAATDGKFILDFIRSRRISGSGVAAIRQSHRQLKSKINGFLRKADTTTAIKNAPAFSPARLD